MPPDFDRFKLSSKRHDDIFEQIKLDLFHDLISDQHPTIICLGGQPGSGKSGLIYVSKNDLGENTTIINGDEFRRYHPNSRQIFIEDEQNYAELTNPDVRVWTKNLLQHALDNRFNVVFESTMREPYPITNTLLQFRENGFTVLARPMAVSAMESITGVFMRYEDQKKMNGYGRMAPISAHDEAYQGVLDTADEIYSKGAAHKIQIYSRSLQQIKEITPLSGDGVPSRYIEQQRNQPVSMKTAMAIVENWGDIYESMASRKALGVEYKNAVESWAVVKSEMLARLQVSFTQRAMLSNAIFEIDSMLPSISKSSEDNQIVNKKTIKNEPEP